MPTIVCGARETDYLSRPSDKPWPLVRLKAPPAAAPVTVHGQYGFVVLSRLSFLKCDRRADDPQRRGFHGTTTTNALLHVAEASA